MIRKNVKKLFNTPELYADLITELIEEGQYQTFSQFVNESILINLKSNKKLD